MPLAALSALCQLFRSVFAPCVLAPVSALPLLSPPLPCLVLLVIALVENPHPEGVRMAHALASRCLFDNRRQMRGRPRLGDGVQMAHIPGSS